MATMMTIPVRDSRLSVKSPAKKRNIEAVLSAWKTALTADNKRCDLDRYTLEKMNQLSDSQFNEAEASQKRLDEASLVESTQTPVPQRRIANTQKSKGWGKLIRGFEWAHKSPTHGWLLGLTYLKSNKLPTMVDFGIPITVFDLALQPVSVQNAFSRFCDNFVSLKTLLTSIDNREWKNGDVETILNHLVRSVYIDEHIGEHSRELTPHQQPPHAAVETKNNDPEDDEQTEPDSDDEPLLFQRKRPKTARTPSLPVITLDDDFDVAFPIQGPENQKDQVHELESQLYDLRRELEAKKDLVALQETQIERLEHKNQQLGLCYGRIATLEAQLVASRFRHEQRERDLTKQVADLWAENTAHFLDNNALAILRGISFKKRPSPCFEDSLVEVIEI